MSLGFSWWWCWAVSFVLHDHPAVILCNVTQCRSIFCDTTNIHRNIDVCTRGKQRHMVIRLYASLQETIKSKWRRNRILGRWDCVCLIRKLQPNEDYEAVVPYAMLRKVVNVRFNAFTCLNRVSWSDIILALHYLSIVDWFRHCCK